MILNRYLAGVSVRRPVWTIVFWLVAAVVGGVLSQQLLDSATTTELKLGGDAEATARRNLVKYIFRVSRALIGNELADELRYPPGKTIGVLPLFRMQQHCHQLIGRLFPRQSQNSNFARFMRLLEASAFGISYRIPDHVYAEESIRW